MRKIQFSQDVLPHLIAIIIFVVVTLVFFKPFFFDSKNLEQHDINQWKGSAQELNEYRESHGEEGLWTNSMFGGMPGYLISVQWSDGTIRAIKQVISLGIPHPIGNIFLAFVCFYILLLIFDVRPYLAIGGALAFGLSTYFMIGLAAGHNSRLGAVAFMPLVLAGIHCTFKKNKILGFGLTATALALELRENHLQLTYYLLIMVLVYGLIMLIEAFRERQLKSFLRKLALLILASIIGIGSISGRLWSTYEYSKFSIRGPSELAQDKQEDENTEGLTKSHAFEYSNDPWGPMTLLIPDFLGGDYSHFLINDEDSQVLKALRTSGDQQMSNSLAQYTSSYWGNKPPAPYYAGAIICFFFMIGLLTAEKKYIIWLGTISLLGLLLSLGDSFKAFNYAMFDYFPGYNKFRSVTFAIIITLIAMPFLGFKGLENLFSKGFTKETQKKFFTAFAITGGLCLFVAIFAGIASFVREGESQLPGWFLNALIADRESLMRSDAIRSMWFIVLAACLVFLRLKDILSFPLVGAILSLLILIDLASVDARYFGEDNYIRSTDNSFLTANDSDNEILKDDSYYRVYSLQGTMAEARTSYFHHSIGGYHGAKLRRYQDLYYHCIQSETERMVEDLQAGKSDLSSFGVINMLNIRYITYGTTKNSIIKNNNALGAAWLVNKVKTVENPDEELNATNELQTSSEAVVDTNKFNVLKANYSTEGTIKLKSYEPGKMAYEYSSNERSFAVFSEIYYPIGWQAEIDGKPINILRANYILRALELPEGKHDIVFTFKPSSYYVGDKITLGFSVLLLLVLLGSLGYSFKVWTGKS